MSSGGTCTHCGSSEIDIDTARGDAVCTSCGSVLEENTIVSEVQFEENAHGGTSAIGQYVADGKGGSRLLPGFRSGIRKESREITLRSAKQRITYLAGQLRLNQHCIDTAHNFFKMALARQLTRGRRSTHVVAACLYITCRTEGTPHMLIDFSDALQVDPYELGRTYLRLATALCINIPALDPCLYILRFSNKLEFGDKTHEVSMTALRLVQRMKRDWMDTGRRPSGLCGAAILIAARLHDFSRSADDIIKVVRVQKSTLKKRLLEFGETPTSSLTPDEFMSIDLEEEQDPPCFKTARRKDKERLQKFCQDATIAEEEFHVLQKEIEKLLEIRNKKLASPWAKYASVDDTPEEEKSAVSFLADDALKTIEECCGSDSSEQKGLTASSLNNKDSIISKLEISPLRLNPVDDKSLARFKTDKYNKSEELQNNGDGTLDLDGIDDKEIDGYLLTQREVQLKTKLWLEANEDYLKEQEEKQKRLKEEEKEGKPEKKKKKRRRRDMSQFHGSAGEAIEKMLAEKKISSKINYDVLRSLNKPDDKAVEPEASETITIDEPPSKKMKETKEKVKEENVFKAPLPVAEAPVEESKHVDEPPAEEEFEEEEEEEYEEDEPMSAAQLLSQYQDEFN